MILVELLTGHHPFAGLADADIRHRLSAAGVDLAGVSDPDWRRLCRGLLLRDPQKRWGCDGVRRWLDGDANLLMPLDDRAVPGAHDVLPHRIEGTLCHTQEELAVALATHWDAGRKDLMGGFVTGWARDELKDQNLVRFLQDLLGQRDIKEDLRLFRLIRHLDPALPPVWRGKSLALPGLCAQAAKAVQDDFPAIDWVVSVFSQRPLQELSPAQYPAEAALAARWEEQHAHCMQLWQETTLARTDLREEQASIQGVSDFDALVYGEPAGLSKPSPFKLLPMLLLALADASYGSDLRQQIRARAGDWLAHNPWLGHLLASGEPAAWVMANFLLPYARDEASSAQKRLELEARQAENARYLELAESANPVLARLRAACASLGIFAGGGTRAQVAGACMQLLELVATARAQGVPQYDPLMRTLRRAEPIVLRIQKRLDAWSQATPLKALWSGVGLSKEIRQPGRSLPARAPQQ